MTELKNPGQACMKNGVGLEVCAETSGGGFSDRAYAYEEALPLLPAIYARLPAWGYGHKTVCHARGESGPFSSNFLVANGHSISKLELCM